MLLSEPAARGRRLAATLAGAAASKRLERREESVGGVPGEWTVAAEAEGGAAAGGRVVLHLHGGAYILGSARESRPWTGALAQRTGCRVLSLDYRLAPEHRFPAALDDAVAAYRALLARGIEPAAITIGGESAGGGLALATLLRLRDEGAPLPARAFLVSPWTDLTMSGRSVEENRAFDYLDPRALERCAGHYAGGADRAQPGISPGLADLRGLPPLFVQCGAVELLRDDAVRLADAVRAAGGRVDLEVGDDKVHAWALLPGEPDARRATARICDFIRDGA
jgi:acetyl esterase/lipase